MQAKEWLEKDNFYGETSREQSYSRKLKDFYIWISDNLANNYELKPALEYFFFKRAFL